jgi:hypothetical protein
MIYLMVNDRLTIQARDGRFSIFIAGRLVLAGIMQELAAAKAEITELLRDGRRRKVFLGGELRVEKGRGVLFLAGAGRKLALNEAETAEFLELIDISLERFQEDLA